MSKSKWDRLAAASGIVFVGLYMVGFLLATHAIPGLSHPNHDWVVWVRNHPRQLKAAAILVGLSILAFVWFVGSIADVLRRADEQRLAAVATASGGASVAVATVGIAIVAALAQRLAIDAPNLTKSLWELATVTLTVINFVGAALVYTTAAATWRSGLFPRWYAWFGSLAALVILVNGGALAYKGFYAPNGGFGLIGTIVFLVWVLATSVLLMRTSGEKEAAAAT